MTTKTQEYRIKFTQQGAQQVQRDTAQLDQQFTGLEKRLSTLSNFAAFAGAASVVGGFLTQASVAASEQEQIFRRLQTAVDLTGSSYETLQPHISATLAEIQRFTQFGDTDSAAVLTQLTQLTGNFSQAMDALPITLDLAASGLFDTNSAARLVGQALAGNVETLGRYIPELRSSNNELLKNASAADKAEIAMDILNEKFGGTAAANVQTTAGSFQQLSNELGDLFEKIGDVANQQLTGLSSITEFVRSLNTALDSGALSSGLDKFTGFIDKFTDFIPVTRLAKDAGEALTSVIGEQVDKFNDINKAIEERKAKAAEALAADEILESQRAANLAAQQAALNALNKQIEESSRKVRQSIEPLKERNTQIQIFRDLMQDVDQVEASISLQVSTETIGSWNSLRGAIGEVGGALESGIFSQLQNGGGLFDNLAEAFEDMLTRMVAALASRAILFGFLNLLSGGSAGALSAFTGLGGDVGSQFGQFVFGGNLSVGGGGLAPSLPPGAGGGTTIINIQANDAKSFERYLRENGGAEAIRSTVGELV